MDFQCGTFSCYPYKKAKPPKGRNTIHKRSNWPKKVKIHYFLHPRYQQEVKIVDKRNFIHETYYLIKLFDRTFFLPFWMTDPYYCHDLTLKKNAQCSLKALHKLRLLIDRTQF